MKVLMCIRKGYLESFAGDSMQLIKTVEYLRKNNVEVDINNGTIWDFSSYDLIHLFNLTVAGETYQYYKRAEVYKKPIVISPIYWNLCKYYNFVKDEYELMDWKLWRPFREEILHGCRMVYPNSNLEIDEIKSEFGKDLPCESIYNGIDPEDANNISLDLFKKFKLKDYVLCVARISPRKNQLILAKICNELQLPLVLIGSINDTAYFKKCMKYNNVTYLGFMDRKDINAFYYHAKIHVLPSFIETPGLSSLEAAANGCSIISTDEGCASEYFEDMAAYCNPYDEKSVAEVVVNNLYKRVNPELKSHILKNYNWETCIKKLYESYKRILY